MKMNNLTIKELIERLREYSEDTIVSLWGGEDEHGSWASLEVDNEDVMTFG